MSGRDQDPSWPSSVCRDPPGIPSRPCRKPRLATLIIDHYNAIMTYQHLVSACPGPPGGGGGHGHGRG